MVDFDTQKAEFLPIFWENITEQQRIDYDQAKEHFGPLYRVEDTNYFFQKFDQFQEGKWPVKNTIITATTNP